MPAYAERLIDHAYIAVEAATWLYLEPLRRREEVGDEPITAGLSRHHIKRVAYVQVRAIAPTQTQIALFINPVALALGRTAEESRALEDELRNVFWELTETVSTDIQAAQQRHAGFDAALTDFLQGFRNSEPIAAPVEEKIRRGRRRAVRTRTVRTLLSGGMSREEVRKAYYQLSGIDERTVSNEDRKLANDRYRKIYDAWRDEVEGNNSEAP